MKKNNPGVTENSPKKDTALTSRITVKSKLNNRVGKKSRNIELARSFV
ncbi:hypothetical protein QFZ73_004740 [Peribacillus sp. V2I11]|nr:hypothetical protein [Peribacillus sp. V2I11]